MSENDSVRPDKIFIGPDEVQFFMDAADERSEPLTIDLLRRSLELVEANGRGMRARLIRRELRWLVSTCESLGLRWQDVP